MPMLVYAGVVWVPVLILIFCLLPSLIASFPTQYNWEKEYANVLRISAMPESDCAIRNMLISYNYQQISLNFKLLLNVSATQTNNTQANWPTIAVWASNSVGMNIRNRTLQIIVEELFAGFPAWFVDAIDLLGPDWIDHVPFVQKLLENMNIGLCAGNRIVFQEVGGAFARFGVSFNSLTRPNATALQDFLNTFSNNQSDLVQALNNYYDAMWTEDGIL